MSKGVHLTITDQTLLTSVSHKISRWPKDCNNAHNYNIKDYKIAHNNNAEPWRHQSPDIVTGTNKMTISKWPGD